MTIQLNRLRSQVAATTHRITRTDKADRKARTRTLIQLGGLVSLAGLLPLLGLAEGDDLQLDPAVQDKAATLLGALSDLSLHLEQDPELKEKWLEKGISLLKKNAYQRLG